MSESIAAEVQNSTFFHIPLDYLHRIQGQWMLQTGLAFIHASSQGTDLTWHLPIRNKKNGKWEFPLLLHYVR